MSDDDIVWPPPEVRRSRSEALAKARAQLTTDVAMASPPHIDLADFTAAPDHPPSQDDLLARLTDDATLMAAWADVRESDLEDGRLSADATRFESRAIDHLAQLKAELDEGTWRPGPVHHSTLTGQGGLRTLTISDIRDRLVERGLSSVLSPVVDPTLLPYCFAYRKGLGVRDALGALREARDSGYSHVARADIEQAFDSIPRAGALASLAARVPDARVVHLVALLLARLDDEGLDGTGIPQGSAVSPMLLNCYLDPLDRAILAHGLLPLRYADDLALPTSSAKAAEDALSMMSDELEHLSLRLNSEKTHVATFAEGVSFLGQRISGLGTPGAGDSTVHPRRISLYVSTEGAWLRLRSGHVRVDRDGEAISSTPLARIRAIVLGTRCGISTPLLRAAVSQGIDVLLVNDHGGYVGRLSRRRGGDVTVRRHQFRTADDPGRSLELARACVSWKIANMRIAVLRDLRRKNTSAGHSNGAKLATSLENSSAYAMEALGTEVLMGIEGAATRAYFEWMSRVLDTEWHFEGRNRRPPRDPINAMLSFGYTLLAAEVVTAVEVAGLDPDLGFLHSPRWGRPSLALDLMEQWRPVLVDAMVLSLARSGKVTPDDFANEPELGCRMADKAKRAFLAAYEKRMLTRAAAPGVEGRRAYRELLGIHARMFADHLVDPMGPPGFYQWR